MKYFIVEGIITNQDKINDEIMKIHMAYTQKAMDSGLILMSGLKSDMSGGIFIMKSKLLEEIEEFYPMNHLKLMGYKSIKLQNFHHIILINHLINGFN